MPNENNWIFETEGEDSDDFMPVEPQSERSPWYSLSMAGILLLVILGAAGFLWFRQNQQSGSEKRLANMVQQHLEMERDAVLSGDGPAFLSLQTDDPAWLARRLDPDNLKLIRAGLQSGSVTQVNDMIVADIHFQVGAEKLKKIAFFVLKEGEILQVGDSPDSYWGAQWQEEYSWGTIVHYSVDNSYREEIAALVGETIAEICSIGCLEHQMPFMLVLGKDFSMTAAPKTLKIPSPRLHALNEDSSISDAYRTMLEQQITAYLTPVHIRFAVAPLDFNYPPDVPLLNYPRAAEAFMQEFPDITVEIISLSEMPENPEDLALNYDGAAVVPTEEMLAAGLVMDLSDYMDTDPAHDWSDFYGQILMGAQWQGRFWWVPQGANMGVIFYDQGLFELAGLPAPSLNWTWDDLEMNAGRLMEVLPENRDFRWGFGDNRLDALYSYAYSWDLDCTEISTIFCANELSPAKITAALHWYQRLVQEEQIAPDFSNLSEIERKNIFLQIQSARRQIGIWVDRPINYENQLLLSPIGTAPFPGSTSYEGIAPLEVYGSFISRASDQPLATWRWLSFLSFQRPSIVRIIPARPSVAQATRFWENLPPALGDSMRVSFPFAQPIGVQEKKLINWEMIAAVFAGEATVEEIAALSPVLRWFK